MPRYSAKKAAASASVKGRNKTKKDMVTAKKWLSMNFSSALRPEKAKKYRAAVLEALLRVLNSAPRRSSRRSASPREIVILDDEKLSQTLHLVGNLPSEILREFTFVVVEIRKTSHDSQVASRREILRKYDAQIELVHGDLEDYFEGNLHRVSVLIADLLGAGILLERRFYDLIYRWQSLPSALASFVAFSTRVGKKGKHVSTLLSRLEDAHSPSMALRRHVSWADGSGKGSNLMVMFQFERGDQWDHSFVDWDWKDPENPRIELWDKEIEETLDGYEVKGLSSVSGRSLPFVVWFRR